MSVRFLKNVGLSTIGQVTSLIVGVATSVVIARCLGAELRGVMAVIVLLPTMIQALVASGFTSTVIHSVASKRWPANEVLPRLYGLACYLALTMFVAAAVAIHYRGILLPGAPLKLLLLSLGLIPVSLLNVCFSAVLRGYSDFRSELKKNILSSVLNLVLAIVFLWVFDLGVEGALYSMILGGLIGLLYVGVLVKRKLDVDTLYVSPDVNFRRHAGDLFYGGKSHVANLATFFSYRLDQLLLNGMTGDAGGVGVYTVAVNNAEKLWLLVNNVGAVIFPFVSENRSDPAGMGNFTARVASLMFWILLFGGVMGGLVAKAVVNFLYGKEFSEVSTIIYWLIPGMIVLGHAKITSNYFAGINRVGLNMIGSIGGLVINVGLNILLIPKHGPVGAAMATSLSYSCSGIYALVMFTLLSKQPVWVLLIPRGEDLRILVTKVTKVLRR